jgi:hypothetical protein
MIDRNEPMNDRTEVKKLDARSARDWLSGEVEIRLPRAWLVLGAALVVVLLIVAFD